MRHLNKLLRDAKDLNQEQELLLVQSENVYGKNMHEIEKLTSSLENEKSDLEEFTKKIMEKEKEIDQIQAEISRCDSLIEQKQRKIVSLNKKLDEVVN